VKLKSYWIFVMRAKFKTPARLCERCNVERPAEKFMPTGEVCYDCKIAAMQKRDTRNKYDPATPQMA